MENCFRFLINVDQCLNMSYFDMFFYKLESQHKFHMNSVQLFGESEERSLRSAIMDIRMYLDKYPYHVGTYQIIVAMRSVFQEPVSHWEQTMLYRLLHLEHELKRAHILINSREQTQKALNLIMLYDADFSAALTDPGNYMESSRLQQDCALLLTQLSLSGVQPSQKDLEQAVDTYCQREGHDAIAASLLLSFLEKRRGDIAHLAAMAEHMDPTPMCADPGSALAQELAEYIRGLLFNFHIFEEQVDRNSRRQQTLALLRVTEFINASTDAPTAISGHAGQMTLSQRCAGNWRKIWDDPTLEQRYADMLQHYRARLSAAAMELERPRFSATASRDVPEEQIPADDAIASSDSMFCESDPQKQGMDLRKILEQFTGHRFSLHSMHSEWIKAYKDCSQLLERMEYQLRSYAENLSRQYASVLEKRKQESLTWRTGFYVAEPDTEKDISRLAYERDQRLQQLKSPQMTPSLSFQDQLNMENALEQANLTVQYYLRCLSAVTAGSFLLLTAVCAFLGLGHYTFLQPYVFGEMSSALCYLAYAAAVLVLMLLCWMLPYNHFKRRLRKCIRQLQEDAEKYISGYYTKAQHFSTYINLLNQLDYITRYHRLLMQAHNASHKLSQGYLWHKVQIRQHLNKLQFFHGLMELGTPPAEPETGSFLPGTDGDQVRDYIDSQIYWPQG